MTYDNSGVGTGSQDEGNTHQPLPSSPALQPFRSHLLVQRLYKHKVDHMIREPATALSRCTQCGEVFSACYRHKLKCEVGVGSEGDPLAAAFRRHILDRGWKVQRLAAIVVILDIWRWLRGLLNLELKSLWALLA